MIYIYIHTLTRLEYIFDIGKNIPLSLYIFPAYVTESNQYDLVNTIPILGQSTAWVETHPLVFWDGCKKMSRTNPLVSIGISGIIY